MTTRTTNWRQIVVEADPEWTRNSRVVEEYEFGPVGKRDEETKGFRRGRTFLGDYQRRGPYAPEE